MDNKKTKVLILEGYCRQVLPFLKAFKDLGCETTLLCDSKWDCGYWSRYADNKILDVCNIERPKETEEVVINLIKRGDYDIVIAPFDFSAEILSHNKETLSKFSRILVNDRDKFDVAHNKLEVMKVCEENDIPHPRTILNAKNIDDIKHSKLPYPVFAKPQSSAGAKGCHIFNSFQELEKGIKEFDIDIPNYIFQECLPANSRLISETLFIDRDNQVKSAYQYESVRYFPLNGGTGTMNVTIDRDDIHETSIKLAKVIGLRGSIALDLMIDPRDDIGKVIEINPRILACSTIGFKAGVNQARQMLENEFGDEVSSQLTYKTGIGVRMLQTDILWFLKSPNRFKCKPSWFSWHNTYEQTFSWKDPLPWFAFLLRGLKNLKTDMKKRRS